MFNLKIFEGRQLRAEVATALRFGATGILATAVNFIILVLLVEYTPMKSVGLASVLSGIGGILASYFGNRIFVFSSKAALFSEASSFLAVHLFSLSLHVIFISLWSDILNLNYIIGFFLATALQAACTYILLRIYVFNKREITLGILRKLLQKKFLQKVSFFFTSTLLFLCVLVSVYYIHMNYFQVDVVLYAAVSDVGVTVAIFSILLLIFKKALPFTGFESALAVTIWLLGGLLVALSVPTVIDRSLSFYILEKIHQRGGGIQESRFDDVFKLEYMVEHRLVDIRLTEQLESGTISVSNGCVELTERGEKIVEISRSFRQNWLPRERLIRGEYTDDLRDPFRESAAEVDYTC